MEEKESKRAYYVCMTDTFMSGWGRAEGKINKLTFECKDYKEAQTVLENAMARSEMQWVNINSKRPYYNKMKYYTQDKTKAECPYWYIKGYFKDRVEVNS